MDLLGIESPSYALWRRIRAGWSGSIQGLGREVDPPQPREQNLLYNFCIGKEELDIGISLHFALMFAK